MALALKRPYRVGILMRLFCVHFTKWPAFQYFYALARTFTIDEL